MSAGTHLSKRDRVMLRMPDGKVYFAEISIIGGKLRSVGLPLGFTAPYVLVHEMHEKTYDKDEESEDEG